MIKLYICQTLDGFIAKEDLSFDFLENVNKEITNSSNPKIANTYADFLKGIDTVVQGFTTYKSISDAGYPNSYHEYDNYVVTKNNLDFIDETVTKFITLDDLVKKDFTNKIVFLVGGSKIIHEFMNLKLVDEIIVFNLPYFLNKGIRLFDNIDQVPEFELLEIINDNKYFQYHYKLNWQ